MSDEKKPGGCPSDAQPLGPRIVAGNLRAIQERAEEAQARAGDAGYSLNMIAYWARDALQYLPTQEEQRPAEPWPICVFGDCDKPHSLHCEEHAPLAARQRANDATADAASEEVARMVHAFADAGRKQ